jgi:outer membrane receptor protein involved in Fe transport
LLKGTNPSLDNIYSGKVDYVHPLRNKYKIEAGMKSSFVRTDNNSDFHNKNNGTWQHDARSNHFIYEENINAAYMNVSKSWEDLQLQAGVRVENTNAKGNQLTTNQQFKRNYTQVFPTAFASYKFNEKHSANINLGRRIRRPDYDALNPFQLLLNPYTYQQGNPLLQPQFSYNGELGYIFKNGLFNVKLGYSDTKNIISDVLTQDEATTVSFVQPENLARQEDFLIQAGSNIKIKKFWTANIFLSVNNLHFKGMLSGYHHDIRFTSSNNNINNHFTMSKGWSAELGGFYQHKNLFSGNSILKPFYMVNTGLSKQVFNDKATVKLSVKDVFNSRKIQIDQNYHEFESYFTNRVDSRTVSLAFTWRFAKNEKNVLRQRNTGASSEEQSRTGNQ